MITIMLLMARIAMPRLNWFITIILDIAFWMAVVGLWVAFF